MRVNIDFYFMFFIEYLSIDGAMRVISDDFSISLLNPDSELYRYKADKYASMVRLLSKDITEILKKNH